MKYFQLAIFFILPLYSFGQDVKIQYDGIYEYLMGNDTSYYLRFYPDGEVMGAKSNSNSANNLKSWFHYENEARHEKGFFDLEETIRIVLNWNNNSASYFEGYSEANGNLQLKQYEFLNGGVKKTWNLFIYRRFD